jgi:hypothetical protein
MYCSPEEHIYQQNENYISSGLLYQPATALDLGIIHAFKYHYRKYVVNLEDCSHDR